MWKKEGHNDDTQLLDIRVYRLIPRRDNPKLATTTNVTPGVWWLRSSRTQMSCLSYHPTNFRGVSPFCSFVIIVLGSKRLTHWNEFAYKVWYRVKMLRTSVVCDVRDVTACPIGTYVNEELHIVEAFVWRINNTRRAHRGAQPTTSCKTHRTISTVIFRFMNNFLSVRYPLLVSSCFRVLPVQDLIE